MYILSEFTLTLHYYDMFKEWKRFSLEQSLKPKMAKQAI